MLDPLFTLFLGSVFLGGALLLFWPEDGLVSRWQRMRRLSQRVLNEDALKHLYVTEIEGRQASLQSLAGTLSISIDEAAQLLEGLEDREFVRVSDGRWRLTPAGREYALHIIRAHRLWERYLADATGYSETEWHEQAERHEHQLSPEDAHSLSAELGHPRYDPHGDPIPTDTGEMVPPDGIPLTALDASQSARIVHIEDEPATIYAQLAAEGLRPGMEIRLLEKSSKRIRFWADGDEHVLAPMLANNLFVVSMPETASGEECETTRLSALSPGERGRVAGISPACRGMERRRLLDLGVIPGTVIEVELRSPGGDPTAYRVRGAVIALRHEQADLIQVECVDSEEEAA